MKFFNKHYIYSYLLLSSLTLLAACGEVAIDKNVDSATTVQNENKIKGSKIYQNPISADKPLDPKEAAKIEFDAIAFDFGAVQEGEKVEHIFKFENTGKSPLLIAKATATCGCTVPSWPRSPIAVGESGEIKVVFDSNKKEGRIEKSVTIIANTIPIKTKLRISGNVIK